MKEINPLSGLEEADLDWPKNNTELAISNECQRIARLLIEKNRAYGNSALEPNNIFSRATATEQLATRIDDKLNRIKKGHEFPGDDTLIDLIGYLILYRIARSDDKI